MKNFRAILHDKKLLTIVGKLFFLNACGGPGYVSAKRSTSQHKLFRDRVSYQTETSPLICAANQWTGFYTIGTSVRKELKLSNDDHFIQYLGRFLRIFQTFQKLHIVKKLTISFNFLIGSINQCITKNKALLRKLRHRCLTGLEICS